LLYGVYELQFFFAFNESGILLLKFSDADMSKLDDHIALLQRLKDKETQAFSEFDANYRKWMEIVATTILQEETQSQEIVQEFLIDFWKEERYTSIEIHSDRSLQNYLFVSLKNRCLNFIKQDERRKKRYALIMEKLNTTYELPFYSLENDELREELTKAMQLLPEGQLKVFNMAYIKGRSRKEISRTLNIAEETVKKQLSNSLKTLRAYLKK
jgi:RNA polymerase sigma factor (sigma-70 family)